MISYFDEALNTNCIIENITCIHNYIDEDRIIRKGAINASEGRLCVIPLNMRDGVLIGIGKGNPNWLNSVGHGAGRTMSRKQAKEKVALEDYQDSMEGIYTSCINEYTLDESPFAYKDSAAIEEAIESTVEVIAHLRPVWNFKDKGDK